MVDFAAAIKRPFEDIKTLIIGWIIGIIPIVNLYITGYALNNAKKSLANDDKLAPIEEDIGGNIVKLIVAFIVSIIYMIPALILLFLGLGAAFTTMLTGGDISSIMATVLSGGIFLILAALFGLLAAFFIPMAILKYLADGNFGAAFAFGDIFKKAFTGTYIIAWIVALVWTWIVGAVLGAIGAALMTFSPFLVMITNGLTLYIVAVSAYTMYAMAYRELK